MFHRWAALVLVLALCAMSPKNAAGQTQSPRGPGAGKLGRPYPNPFNPEVFIPFTVTENDGTCTDGRQLHVVNVRILNILAELVAVPTLQGPGTNSTTGTTNVVGGTRLSSIKLGCGSYLAYWDGFMSNGKEASSGMYLVQFFVDGKLGPDAVKRIFNRK